MAPLTAAQARAAVKKVKAEAKARGQVLAPKSVKITPATTATGRGLIQFREIRILEAQARRVAAALEKRSRSKAKAAKSRSRA